MEIGILWALMALSLLVLGGCASTTTLETHGGQTSPAPHGYALTEKDKALDCATMRGRMQIALLQLKAQDKDHDSSHLARHTQSSVTQIFGGPSYGTDRAAYSVQETSRLRAYNQWLKDQNCRAYDLDQELIQASNS